MNVLPSLPQVKFLSTPSVRRATSPLPMHKTSQSHFYPRPPYGGRHSLAGALVDDILFLSTPSVRRATCSVRHVVVDIQGISIHALRTEGDVGQDCLRVAIRGISIHALRTEGDEPGR